MARDHTVISKPHVTSQHWDGGGDTQQTSNLTLNAKGFLFQPLEYI